MKTNTTPAPSAETASSAPKVKLFDVFYGDFLRKPRLLVVEIFAGYLTAISESGGEHNINLPPSKWTLMDLKEWTRFADHLADDRTPKEMREYREHASGPFEWPKLWLEFKARYETTGNAYLGEPLPGRLTEWPPSAQNGRDVQRRTDCHEV